MSTHESPGPGRATSPRGSVHIWDHDAAPSLHPDLLLHAWRVLADDPLTSMHVVDADGHLLARNAAAARPPLNLLRDPSERTLTGELLRHVHEALRDGARRYVRIIQHGRQVLATIAPMPVATPNPRESPAQQCALITIRAQGGELRDAFKSAGTAYHELASVDLGSLGVLSRRELQVLALIGLGRSMPETAAELGLSVHTAQDHRKAIGKKLGIDDRVRLAQVAFNAGLRVHDASLPRSDKMLHDAQDAGQQSLD